MKLVDVQIDRVVGPTHHFGGLGVGNVASQQHAGNVSNPAAAAIQGLDKMRLVAGLGVPQFMLPPQKRPDFQFLRNLGFTGTDSEVLIRAKEEAPHLLSAATSSSAMWTANAATVTAAVDASPSPVDSSAIVTTANLCASVHRAIEPEQTQMDLRSVLPSSCQVFGPISGGAALRDEGAANHMRLSTDESKSGINVFVYGDGEPKPSRNWPRQSRAAFEAVARRHRLPKEQTFFIKQHPDAIDAGAFHNDVVAISHHDLLIHHELAFADAEETLQRIEQRFHESFGIQLRRIAVPCTSLSIDDAVKTYLFNSQVVSTDAGGLVLICTSQVERHEAANRLAHHWCEQNLFGQVHFVDLDQSMSGGGGPACLRLRVPLPESELETIDSTARWSHSLDQRLREAIDSLYVSRLTIDDLARPEFHAHAEMATQRLSDLLLRDHRE